MTHPQAEPNRSGCGLFGRGPSSALLDDARGGVNFGYVLLAGLVALGALFGLSLLTASSKSALYTVACQLSAKVTGSSAAGCATGSAPGDSRFASVQDPLTNAGPFSHAGPITDLGTTDLELGIEQVTIGLGAERPACSDRSCLNVVEWEEQQQRSGGFALPPSVIEELTAGLPERPRAPGEGEGVQVAFVGPVTREAGKAGIQLLDDAVRSAPKAGPGAGPGAGGAGAVSHGAPLGATTPARIGGWDVLSFLNPITALMVGLPAATGYERGAATLLDGTPVSLELLHWGEQLRVISQEERGWFESPAHFFGGLRSEALSSDGHDVYVFERPDAAPIMIGERYEQGWVVHGSPTSAPTLSMPGFGPEDGYWTRVNPNRWEVVIESGTVRYRDKWNPDAPLAEQPDEEWVFVQRDGRVFGAGGSEQLAPSVITDPHAVVASAGGERTGPHRFVRIEPDEEPDGAPLPRRYSDPELWNKGIEQAERVAALIAALPLDAPLPFEVQQIALAEGTLPEEYRAVVADLDAQTTRELVERFLQQVDPEGWNREGGIVSGYHFESEIGRRFFASFNKYGFPAINVLMVSDVFLVGLTSRNTTTADSRDYTPTGFAQHDMAHAVGVVEQLNALKGFGRELPSILGRLNPEEQYLMHLAYALAYHEGALGPIATELDSALAEGVDLLTALGDRTPGYEFIEDGDRLRVVVDPDQLSLIDRLRDEDDLHWVLPPELLEDGLSDRRIAELVGDANSIFFSELKRHLGR